MRTRYSCVHRGSIRPLPNESSPSIIWGCVRQPLGESHWPTPSDDASSIKVCVHRVSALRAAKDSLLRATGSVLVTAAGTSLRGLAWVAERHGDSQPCSLVADKVYKLAEGPRGNHAIKSLRATNSTTNPIQVFKDKHRVGVKSREFDNLLGELVVQISHPVAFFALRASYAICSLGPTVAASQVGEVFSSVSSGLAVEEQSSVWCSDDGMSHDTQINADEGLTGTSGWHWGYADRKHGIPIIATLKELSISINKSKPIDVFLRHTQRKPNIMPALSDRDAQSPEIAFALEGVGINSQANSLTFVELGERGFAFSLAQSVEGAGQRDSSVDRHASVVRGKTESAGRFVDKSMQLAPVTGLVFASGVQSQLYSRLECLSRLHKPLTLARVRSLDLDGQTFYAVHKLSIANFGKGVKPFGLAADSSPYLKVGAFSAEQR